MMQQQATGTVPKIFAPPTAPIRLAMWPRLVAAAVALACAAIVMTAVGLTPSASGLGTHRDLGLTACGMLATTGTPCPTCGMTTSFAWFYRGNLAASAYVQPAGFVAAYLTGMLMLLAGYEAATARPIHRLWRYVPTRWWMIGGLAIFLAGWGWKIMIHRAGMDGWGL